MSHDAIVAFEYGFLAVVSILQATRRIKTGQPVQIDGTQYPKAMGVAITGYVKAVRERSVTV